MSHFHHIQMGIYNGQVLTSAKGGMHRVDVWHARGGVELRLVNTTTLVERAVQKDQLAELLQSGVLWPTDAHFHLPSPKWLKVKGAVDEHEMNNEDEPTDN